MTDFAAAEALLRCALNDDAAAFREGQWEAIDAIVNQRQRLLVVQRTGWGKSSVYFIATRIMRDRGFGPTLIVSPLLALMRNQIEAAGRLGIRALTINSSNKDQWAQLHRAILANEIDALLISPERLANDEFVEQVLIPISNSIGFLVVDEAHCISDWGHDFRPDYRRLANILERMPVNVPILGTTATANNRVIADVKAQLGNIRIQRGALVRDTLVLQNLRLRSQVERLAWLADHIPELPGTGIVYALTKRDAEQVSEWLNSQGISARAYHSSVVADGFEDANSYRQHLEQLLYDNKIKVLVATTALGMGYDKPDLGFVIHYQAPGSIVAYYQQVGRAGRGIDHAVGVLLTGIEDADIHAHFRKSAFPREVWVRNVLDLLAATDGLSANDIQQNLNIRRGQIDQILKILSVESPAPVIKDGAQWRRTAVPFQLDHERIRRLSAQRELEWNEVQAYIDERGCLMQYLGRALDDPEAGRCGRCANCIGHLIVPNSYRVEVAAQAALFLRHADIRLECKKLIPGGAFVDYQFFGKLAEPLRPEVGRILSRWGDAGWGQMVAQDKHRGHFRNDLVEAVAEMIEQRWRPDPLPSWMTCVPSTNHPDLVPDFCRRLALRLKIPFHAVITKVKVNEPQKEQQNSFHQSHNLDGAFAVDMGLAPAGPVLLVDDIFDSGWTLTVTSALLRRAGSGPVLPLALAASGTD